MAAERERLAADHEDDDDHQERERALQAGRPVVDAERVVQEVADVGRVGQDQALGDPERDTAEQGERERREPPMSATARAATVTTMVKTERLGPALGASRMPASPAVAPPMAQVIVARRLGDQPSAATARSFSALAEIASPTLVYA